MSPSNVKRKLAAILAADAVGFSRQMGENEERTMRVLSAHRAVIDGIIVFHDGRIVGTAGDSVLAEFASPVEALRCAVEIQDAIRTRNDSLPEGERMQFRIGINLGDVMVNGDDLLGDGVNVAARLEGIAEPGGICISSSVYDQIAGKLDLGFVEIGEQKLKNIARPIRVYRVSGGAQRPAASPAQKQRAVWPYASGIALVVLAAIAGFWLFHAAPPAPVAAPATSAAPPASTAETQRAQEARLLAENQAKADLATQNTRAEAEIAKARAEAEVARARAETAAIRRQAAADLAAARAKPAAASPAAIVPPASPAPVAATAPAMAAPAKVASVASSATSWSAQRNCESIMERPPLSDEVPVKLSGDEFVLEKGEAGQPGYFILRGKSGAEGALALAGHAISGMPGMRGMQVPAHYEGRLEGNRYEMKGQIGRRPCSLTLTRKAP